MLSQLLENITPTLVSLLSYIIILSSSLNNFKMQFNYFYLKKDKNNSINPLLLHCQSLFFYGQIPQKSFQVTVSTNPLLSPSLDPTLIKQWPRFIRTVLTSLEALSMLPNPIVKPHFSSLLNYQQHLTQSILLFT